MKKLFLLFAFAATIASAFDEKTGQIPANRETVAICDAGEPTHTDSEALVLDVMPGPQIGVNQDADVPSQGDEVQSAVHADENEEIVEDQEISDASVEENPNLGFEVNQAPHAAVDVEEEEEEAHDEAADVEEEAHDEAAEEEEEAHDEAADLDEEEEAHDDEEEEAHDEAADLDEEEEAHDEDHFQRLPSDVVENIFLRLPLQELLISRDLSTSIRNSINQWFSRTFRDDRLRQLFTVIRKIYNLMLVSNTRSVYDLMGVLWVREQATPLLAQFEEVTERNSNELTFLVCSYIMFQLKGVFAEPATPPGTPPESPPWP